jgi:argininosuccinate synthase
LLITGEKLPDQYDAEGFIKLGLRLKSWAMRNARITASAIDLDCT